MRTISRVKSTLRDQPRPCTNAAFVDLFFYTDVLIEVVATLMKCNVRNPCLSSSLLVEMKEIPDLLVDYASTHLPSSVLTPSYVLSFLKLSNPRGK